MTTNNEILVWQDIFDLFKEQIDEIKGRFLGNNDVEYYFEGKWNQKDSKWVVHFWII